MRADATNIRKLRQARHYLDVLIAAEKLVASAGFTLDHVAILQLLGKREPLSNTDIAQALGLSPATVTRCMDKLTGLELVRGALDESDLRKNSFRLQSRGRSILFELENRLGKELNLGEAVHIHRALECVAQKGKQGDPKIPSGIAPQGWLVLLAAAEGSATVGTLSQRAAIAQPRVSIALHSLTQKGLARPSGESDSSDSRRHTFALTADGIALVRFLLDEMENTIHQEI